MCAFNECIRKGSPGADTTLDLCWELLLGHLNIAIQFSYILNLGWHDCTLLIFYIPIQNNFMA